MKLTDLFTLKGTKLTCCGMIELSGCVLSIFIKVKIMKTLLNYSIQSECDVLCKACEMHFLFLNQSDKHWVWALFLKNEGLIFLVIATG